MSTQYSKGFLGGLWVGIASLVWANERCFANGIAATQISDRWSPHFYLRTGADYYPDSRMPMDGYGWFVAPVHAALTPDGRVLVIGASKSKVLLPYDQVIDTVARFDPSDVNPGVQENAIVEHSALYPGFDVRQWTMFCSGHTFLSDGRLLVIGGVANDVPAEEYQPWLPPFRDQPPMWAYAPQGGLDVTQVYDWHTNAWTYLSDAGIGRVYYPGLARTHEGNVLSISGFKDLGEVYIADLQYYDPKGGWNWLYDEPHDQWDDFRPAFPNLRPNEADYVHAYLLQVPVNRGGRSRQAAMLGILGDIYLLDYSGAGSDPGRILLQNTRPSLPEGTEGMWGTTTALLKDGTILMAGGSGDQNTAQRADFYNPNSDAWRSTLNTGISRYHPTAVLTPDGNIVLVNGETLSAWTGAGDPNVPQLILPPSTDESTGTWMNGTAQRPPVGGGPEAMPNNWQPTQAPIRGYHSLALLLTDGSIYVAGGETGLTPPPHADERVDSQFYYPRYLDPALDPVRPRITAVSTNKIQYGVDFTITFSGGINRVALIGLGAVTHSVDMNQRYVELWNGSASGSLTLNVPRDLYKTPAGYYMLFILHKETLISEGRVSTEEIYVPAPASIVHIDQ